MIQNIRDKVANARNDTDLRELLRSGGFVLFFKVLGALSGLIFALVVTRNTGASVYGVFELSFTVLMISGVLVKMGLDTAILRFTPEYLSRGQSGSVRALYFKSLRWIGVAALVGGLLLYFLRSLLSDVFESDSLESALLWVALGILPFSLLQFNAESLRAFKKMKAFALYQQGTALVLAAFLFYLLLPASIPENSKAILAFVAAVTLLMGFSFFTYLSTLKKQSEPGRSPVDMKQILRVSLPMLVSGSLFLVISWTDTLMIGYFETDDQIGIYRIAFRVATLITFIQFAVNSIAAPVIARFYSEQKMDALRGYVRQIGIINTLTSVPIFIILVFFRSFFLQLFGAEFEQGAWVLPVLAVGQLVNALCGPVMYILNMTGKEKISQRIMLWTALANVLLNLWLIPVYGILGAALSTTATMIAWNVIAAVKVYRMYHIIAIPYRWK